jgi:hypothetical protein
MKKSGVKEFLKSIRIIVLTVLLSLSVYVAVGISTQKQDTMWPTLLASIAVSLLSTVVGLYIFWDIDRKPPFDTTQLKGLITESINLRDQSPFNRIDPNRKMGDEYWIKLIDDLDTSPEDVWFVGTKLSTWLVMPVYSTPLRVKFHRRFSEIILKAGKANKTDGYVSYILLADPKAVLNWVNFFQEIIKTLVKDVKSVEKKANLEKLCWSKVIICTLPESSIKYSLVLCGKRLSVTQYLSSGRSDDSPTLDIKPDSDIYQLYKSDLRELLKIAKVSSAGSTERISK